MDANFTTQRFPAGTSVGAYPKSNWPASTYWPSGAAVGSATATATVGADSTLALTGLTDGTDYFLHGLVGSEHRYVSFSARSSSAVPTAADITTAVDAEAAARAAADTVVAANARTASYTLVLADAGKCVEMNHATNSLVLTVPPNASVAFPVGTVIEVARMGAGTVTITPGAAVTIPNRLEAAGTTSRTIADQYGTASLRKTATNVWVLVGDLA